MTIELTTDEVEWILHAIETRRKVLTERTGPAAKWERHVMALIERTIGRIEP